MGRPDAGPDVLAVAGATGETLGAHDWSVSPLVLIERERHVLGQIATGVPLAHVLDDLLRAVEAQSGHTMLTSVLFLSEDGGHLRHGAAPSLPAAYNAAVDGIAVGEGVGSCGTVASRGEPVYAADIASDPLWTDFRDLALAHGLRACWSTPIKAADGTLLGTFAVYYDAPRSPTPDDIETIAFITQTAALAIERYRSDRELQCNQERLRAANAELEQEVEKRTAERNRLWQNSLDLLAVASPDGTLDAVNRAWTTLLGWEEADLVGSKFSPLVHPEDAGRTAIAFADIFSAPLVEPFEYRMRRRDGSYRWVAWTAVFEDGKVYANGRDVTAEHEQAAALAAAEEQLRQSQKMEAVGQLTGGLAHDFNNLLTGIIGSLELLQSRIAQGRLGELERYVAAAQGAAKRAASLTHRLLAFSRRQTLDPKPTDVNRLVAGMEELIRRTAGPAITVEVVAAGGLWTTLIDPGQLENALLNLCINARDAMAPPSPEEGARDAAARPGDGRLTIETGNKWLDQRAARARELLPGQYVTLCVSDTGSGMSAEVIRRAFDPFFTTKPIGMGTGLGLSMVYGFARQSGGSGSHLLRAGQRHDGLPLPAAPPRPGERGGSAGRTRERVARRAEQDGAGRGRRADRADAGGRGAGGPRLRRDRGGRRRGRAGRAAVGGARGSARERRGPARRHERPPGRRRRPSDAAGAARAVHHGLCRERRGRQRLSRPRYARADQALRHGGARQPHQGHHRRTMSATGLPAGRDRCAPSHPSP